MFIRRPIQDFQISLIQNVILIYQLLVRVAAVNVFHICMKKPLQGPNPTDQIVLHVL